MSSRTNIAMLRRRQIDGWRWAGRFFLLFMLVYTAVPMLWMMVTSIKSGFAAMAFPPEWWPGEPTLASYRNLLDPQNSVGKQRGVLAHQRVALAFLDVAIEHCAASFRLPCVKSREDLIRHG